MYKILFVCHGNICRSPMAEFIFLDMLKKRGITGVTAASAATSTEEIGNPVYYGTASILRRLGIDFSAKRARQMTRSDAEEYDLLVVCYEGSVRVVVPVGELVLQPGRKVLYDSAGVRLSDVSEPLPAVLSFNAVPLEEVIRSIEEIFGVTVTGQEPYEAIVFTGFITTSDLDGTLEAVFRACGIPYRVSGNEISLK